MINDFKVGCDPEFMLLSGNGHTAEVNHYFPHMGEIGYDHGGRVAEFRPAPTKGVYPLVQKIQALVKKVVQTVPDKRLRAGAICNNDCLGGHVHFGFPCFEGPIYDNLAALNGGRLNVRGQQATKALDTLTKTLEHLDILPKNESEARRASAQGRGANYGAYGDVRNCNGHMEYRTMASWLYDPKVAFLCLTAAKIAAADPEGTEQALRGGNGEFKALLHWMERYGAKDINAARACEKLLDHGLRYLQVDPSVDFRERWERLGL